MNYTAKVKKNGKVIQRVQTHSKRRFLHRIRTLNWEDGGVSIYLRVSYGDGVHNNGIYKSKEDFDHALSAFTEEN